MSKSQRITFAVQGKICACVVLLTIIYALFGLQDTLSFRSSIPSNYSNISNEQINSVALRQQITVVVASQVKDSTTWLSRAFPSWSHQVYVADDPDAALSVPMNKGRESMVYLTYIIDNYDKLPPISIFRHASRFQWHTDDPLYDGQRILARLQMPFVQEQGYVNLRCVWMLGCPAEIRPYKPIEDQEAGAGPFYRAAFEHLFPGVTVPEEIGVSCCAQFAVTNWKIRARPKSDYERYRQWLLETVLPDDLSGRIFEYSWHIIFGKPAVHCPEASQCYCSVFGLCDLICEEVGICRSQYTLPKHVELPEGWPDYDWDGKWQNATAM